LGPVARGGKRRRAALARAGAGSRATFRDILRCCANPLIGAFAMSHRPSPDSGRPRGAGNPPAPAEAEALRAQATRCRRLADSIDDREALATLCAMATDYEARARALEGPRN
jgi:hypothetical protein